MIVDSQNKISLYGSNPTDSSTTVALRSLHVEQPSVQLPEVKTVNNMSTSIMENWGLEEDKQNAPVDTNNLAQKLLEAQKAITKKNGEIHRLKTATTAQQVPRPDKTYQGGTRQVPGNKNGHRRNYKLPRLWGRQCVQCREDANILVPCKHCRLHTTPQQIIDYSACQEAECMERKDRAIAARLAASQ